MEKLDSRYEQLAKAYATLKHMIEKFNYARNNPKKIDADDLIAYRDSVIKRFEYCYDLTWKFLKKYLEQKYAVEENSPKKVLQECAAQKIILQDELASLLDMVDDRNMTCHVYNEEVAQEISLRIEEYSKILSAIIQRLGAAQ